MSTGPLFPDAPGVDPEPIRLPVPPDAAGTRLDVFLGETLAGQSRASARHLIDDGHALVDGARTKASFRLKGEETLTITIPDVRPPEVLPEAIPLAILYEDDVLLVVNKPPGMVVHPAPGHERGTLVNALLHHCGALAAGGAPVRPGLVHRLDEDTSGAILVAKTEPAHRALGAQFEARTVRKTYRALTQGVPRPREGIVEGEMSRHPGNRLLRALLPGGGRYSRSRYRTLESFGSFASVEVELETGRTHQARVHLASVGAPVLSDAAYGGGGAITRGELMGEPDVSGGDEVLLARQALHAWRLAFDHPGTGTRMAFEAPLPPDIQQALAALRERSDTAEPRPSSAFPGR